MGIGETWKNFFDEQLGSQQSDTKFAQAPIPPKEFFEVWMGQPLFPEQINAINALFTPDFKDLRTDMNEALLMWGEGSGKDFLSERILIYVAYWLLCLKSPHKYLGRAEGTPIDLVNTSVNEEHASNVFFKQFCDAIRLVINPATGHNWFEEQGMDTREGKDILTSQVRFPKHITAYSLNSVKYTGEGKNILISVLDEIAEFKYQNAKNLYSNLKATCTSRFPKFHKIIMISYLRDEFDFMNSHWEEVETYPPILKSKYYKSKKATWEVNLNVKKEDYQDKYDTDPEDSARRFENVMPKKTAKKFLRNADRVLSNIRSYEPSASPILSETPYWSTNLSTEVFAPWFKPGMTKEIYELEVQYAATPTEELKKKIEVLREAHQFAKYYIHIDLSKGAYDFAGLTLLHPYKKTESQVGYYVDLTVQLRPEESEINFEDIRTWLYQLQDKGFEIAKVSLDGWNSTDFMQQLERKNIATQLVSMDRSLQPYNTLKDILYQGLTSFYYHPILVRELNELQCENDKVDHPKESAQRLKEEGKKAGSKDCADSYAGAIFIAVTDGSGEAGAVADPSGTDDVTEQLDKFFGL